MPLTLAGAMAHVRGLEIAGVVLLVVLMLENAIVLPVLHARMPRRS